MVTPEEEERKGDARSFICRCSARTRWRRHSATRAAANLARPSRATGHGARAASGRLRRAPHFFRTDRLPVMRGACCCECCGRFGVACVPRCRVGRRGRDDYSPGRRAGLKNRCKPCVHEGGRTHARLLRHTHASQPAEPILPSVRRSQSCAHSDRGGSATPLVLRQGGSATPPLFSRQRSSSDAPPAARALPG